MLRQIYIDSSDPKKVINMGLLLFFIQNLLILVIDLIIISIGELGALLFLASLWIDIIAGITLLFGFRAYSKNTTIQKNITKRISYMFMIWVPIALISRVLTNMNFTIRFITDGNLILILFTIWVITSLYFSFIIYNMIKFFGEIEQTNFLIPKLYLIINFISAMLIGIGLIPTQTIVSIFVAGETLDSYPISVIFGITIIGLGALSKVTLVPILGLISFHIFRNVWDLRLNSNEIKKSKTSSNLTFKPKKIKY